MIHNIFRWVHGFLIGMIAEYLYRVGYNVWPFLALLALIVLFLIDTIASFEESHYNPQNPSEEYMKYIAWMRINDPNLGSFTRTQYEFVEFLLLHKNQISKIGNLESPFISVRKYLKS